MSEIVIPRSTLHQNARAHLLAQVAHYTRAYLALSADHRSHQSMANEINLYLPPESALSRAAISLYANGLRVPPSTLLELVAIRASGPIVDHWARPILDAKRRAWHSSKISARSNSESRG